MLDEKSQSSGTGKKRKPIIAGVDMAPEDGGSQIVPVADLLPPNLFLVPVVNAGIFPGMVLPLVVPEGKLSKTADHAMDGAGYLGLVFPRHSDIPVASGAYHGQEIAAQFSSPAFEGEKKTFKEEDFYSYGVAIKILKRINLPDNQVSLLAAGLQRFRIKKILKREPHFVANVEYIYEDLKRDVELEALMRSALAQFKKISKDNPLISEEVKVAMVNIDGPGKLTDFMASVLIRDVSDFQQFLSLADVKERLRHLLVVLKKESEVQSVQRQIQDDISNKVNSAQKEYYLNEQLKLIQKELGNYTDTKTKLMEKFESRLEGKQLTKEARSRIDEELDKLNNIHEQSSEFSVCINYLDWATTLPWGTRSKENFDLRAARNLLESDHYGLKDVKDRILEFLAVRKLKNTSEGTILCFVGAPGTGKTSLGKSIAKVVGRKFYRFSVGGMRDEAEIKGHRRTYVGAMPGKIIQGMKRVGTQNPVFLIDEIDKMGNGWAAGGDPSSALLEVLDPEQNKEFLDHYLDIPFDCSEILFITTANSLDGIPSALLDRMEIIHLHGYSELEKFHIAKRHLIPRQLEKHALKKSSLKIHDVALRYILSHYAREGGVRNLEKQLGRICRKVAYKHAMGRTTLIKIDSAKVVESYLGKPPFIPEKALDRKIPGVVTGLAWTEFGGEVLQVESAKVLGKGGLKLTGSLGEVMQESANIAYTYVRGRADSLKLTKDFFEDHTLHIHVPAGATPKDGPSAGITMVTSLYSLLSKKPVKAGVGMTGELTLSGQVLPVGGIKEKILAAKRAGLKTILLPKENARDLKDLDAEIKRGLRFVNVATMDDCLRAAF